MFAGRITPFKMLVKVVFLFVGLQTVLCQNENPEPRSNRPCYTSDRIAQRCQPPFVNAAYDRVFEATNTCGMNGPTSYCVQTKNRNDYRSTYCSLCDNRDPSRRHPPEYLSDFNNNTRQKTWWQSDTMREGMQYPTQVNLTLHLEKAFDITYVQLRFYSPRPESFAIYKRTRQDGPWTPYQFYSASCETTYGLRRDEIITVQEEDRAVCTPYFSGISPLTGGAVAFSTLEGRPSMFRFNSSPKLQEWVTATDLRIVLTRMNTFGDEVFGDSKVLSSYFYAISDLSVGARCKCNGVRSRTHTLALVRDLLVDVCKCEHNTKGVDCQMCKDFYNDQPWMRATETDAHECKACDCNGLSETCVFDEELYRRTGHGGRCTDCKENTDGIHCELCKANFWRSGTQCLQCACNPIGSVSLQCDDQGQCRCKPGVGGQRCDQCLPNFYDFGEDGCVACECDPSGSLDNTPSCDSDTGRCRCKDNVDGRRCDKCKPGYFGLNPDDPFGCISCFCYGHSSECSSADGYYAHNITSDFDTGNQGWTAVDERGSEVASQYHGISKSFTIKGLNEILYFSAPARYLGDQRFSYDQYLTFDLFMISGRYRGMRSDIVLEGGNGQKISIHMYAQGNQLPTVGVKNTFTFRIHEHRDYMWYPQMNAVDLIGLLSNLTAIKIKGTYNKT
ncbi:hypothetical protein EGW08_018504, partial [Elysia chlorotica]